MRRLTGKSSELMKAGSVVATMAVACFVVAGLAAVPAHAEEPFVKAPALALDDLQGKKIDVDYDANGLTLVNFWATWCLPCRTEMPQIDRLYARYGSQGLKAVGVAVESGDSEDVRVFIQNQIKVSYPILMGAARTTDIFGPITIVPTTYLIGPGGIVLSTHIGVTHDFESALAAEIEAALAATSEGRAMVVTETKPKKPAEKIQLTPSEKSVVEALLADWTKRGHLSSVDLVMRNMGMSISTEARIRLARFIRDSEGLHHVIDAYGPITAMLSRDEKMIIRALLIRQKAGEPVPTIQELSGLTGSRRAVIPASLEVLESLEFLEPYPAGHGVGMRIAPSMAGFMDPMDLAATTVTMPEKKPFGIASLPRFLTDMVTSPPAGRVVVDGLCSHCVSKIRIVMENGHVILPTSAALLLGGGSYDALFLSKAHLDEWMKDNPAMNDLPRLEVTGFVQSLHDRPEIVHLDEKGPESTLAAALK
jgi:thiol-disulfide isomerase/thioredoxin